MPPSKIYRSHTILIIDNSGSMRIRDVHVPSDTRPIMITRHKAVFDALAEGVFKPQILRVTKEDVVTMVKLGDDATVVLDAVPFVRAAKFCENPEVVANLLPKSHGKYLPALDMLVDTFDKTSSHCINVLFFSDGKPSDPPTRGKDIPADQKVRKAIVAKTLAVCQHPRLRRAKCFNFHTVGFGLDDFSTLKEMAAVLPAGQGMFHKSGLDVHALTSTLSSFSNSVSHSITVSEGPRRPLIPVQVSKRSDVWIEYDGVTAWHAPPALNAQWQQHLKKWSIRVSEHPFDRGGLRNVFNLRFEGNSAKWVAKRDRRVATSEKHEKVFHQKHLVTQGVAAAWANRFTASGKQLGYSTKLKFLDCWLMELGDGYVFVERKLQGKYTKWNSNNGKVKNLNSKTEVLQAFSHYTHHKSGCTKLVCDLQGVYNEEKCFSLVDPVIHSIGGRQGRYGRTDRGQRGIDDFFKSHKCNEMCALYGLPHNNKYEASNVAGVAFGFDNSETATVIAQSVTATVTTSTSRATNDITVIKTHHLAQRQDERDISTLELRSAVKRGSRSRSGNRLKITHNNIDYITDKTAKIGITAYRPEIA